MIFFEASNFRNGLQHSKNAHFNGHIVQNHSESEKKIVTYPYWERVESLYTDFFPKIFIQIISLCPVVHEHKLFFFIIYF